MMIDTPPLHSNNVNNLLTYGTIFILIVVICLSLGIFETKIQTALSGGKDLHYILFALLLSLIAIFENKTGSILDKLTLPGILLGIISTILFNSQFLVQNIIGAFGGGLFFYLVALGYYYWKKRPAIGGGIIKLAAMVGSFVGIVDLSLIFVVSTIMAVVLLLGQMISTSGKGRIQCEFGLYVCFFAMINIIVPFRNVIHLI